MVGGAVLSVLLALAVEALFVGVQRLIVSPGDRKKVLAK
jgi:osmoprotectant transport system permease protein